ncbi:hypothetical protein KUA23_04340 [Pseudomonas pergaminensis]|uniref:Uncharacterized protein n=1 Tax=Pseudomonas pergaminensis TaxID=2853159 RepID=A0ABD7TK97_9PSED|nr:hypothetical protein [Pseudomonas pergaminensis]USW01966.1 hypothetical protein KUA23_04340 [Pseudomonas pergaminensis]
MKNNATGRFKWKVGAQAFESTDLGFVADDQSEDFVVQARSTASDGVDVELTLYIPERDPQRKKYTYGSHDEYQASVHYTVGGRPNSWQGGYVVREAADFSSSDPGIWRVKLIFGIEVALNGGVMSIKGEGDVKGAAPWGKTLRKRFPSKPKRKPLPPG